MKVVWDVHILGINMLQVIYDLLKEFIKDYTTLMFNLGLFR